MAQIQRQLSICPAVSAANTEKFRRYIVLVGVQQVQPGSRAANSAQTASNSGLRATAPRQLTPADATQHPEKSASSGDFLLVLDIAKKKKKREKKRKGRQGTTQ